MSTNDAAGFLERLESDERFAHELEGLKESPDAVYEKVKAAGFDAQPEEIREAFVERYGAQLTPEQLDQIAGGSDAETDAIIGGLLGGMVAVVGASAAAGC